MAQKIDIKISYGKHRMMGTGDERWFNNLMKNEQFVSLSTSDDGTEIYLDFRRDRITFRMVHGRPTIIVGKHPNSVDNWDLPTFKDYLGR